MEMQLQQKRTVSQCRADGIPLFTFGSKDLDELHERALEPAMRVGTRGEGWYFVGGGFVARWTYDVYGRQYGTEMDGFRYVVDHGHFYTLNTIHGGQRVPESMPLEP